MNPDLPRHSCKPQLVEVIRSVTQAPGIHPGLRDACAEYLMTGQRVPFISNVPYLWCLHTVTAPDFEFGGPYNADDSMGRISFPDFLSLIQSGLRVAAANVQETR